MSPHTHAPRIDEHPPAFAADCHAMPAGPESGIIGAFLQALNGSGHYRIVDLGGELFLEPQDLRMPLAQGRELEI